MKQGAAKSLRVFAAELAIYAVLVTGYFFLVLHVLGNWLYQLETQHRIIYAFVAILLIAGQAVVLDAVTTTLFRLLRRRWGGVMFFPTSHSHIDPLYLVLVGFFIGILGGFFGVGGSFIAGPALRLMGVDWNYAVGTDLAHIVGKSIVAARKHRTLGNVDLK